MNSFEITIDRIEGEKAIVKTQENETFTLPTSWFKEKIKEGQVFFVSLKNLQEKEKAAKEQARDILNELLEVE